MSMERWAAPKATAAPARRYGADQPSFSSTLLDAIYNSMDEPAATGVEAAKKQHEALHYGYYYKPSLAGSYRAAPHAHATTSSSSECSSYGGFSSSEAESSHHHHHHRRLRPIRTAVVVHGGGAPASAPAPEKKAKKAAGAASIRAKLRDLRKPASPGARLAGFLNSIFAGKRGVPPPTPPSARAAAESACSTASSYSRSCLSKTPSTRGQPKRTVRFLDSDDTESLASSSAAAVDRRSRVPVEAVKQMLLQRMEMESDEDDDDDESSDASSDLFELENFASAAHRDELPVYETTRVALNRAIGHGFGGHGRSARVV